jgi:hypothetical protein
VGEGGYLSPPGGAESHGAGADREAVAHLEQALVAVRPLPGTRETTELTIDIHFDLRNAFSPFGDWAHMREHLNEAEVLARSLGDQHWLGRTATFMAIQCVITGDYDGAVGFGWKGLAIARTLGDRSIEVLATSYLGATHLVRASSARRSPSSSGTD